MVDKLLFIASSPVPGTADGLRFLRSWSGGSNLNLLTFVGIVNFQSQLGRQCSQPVFASTLNIAQRKQ